MRGSRVQCFRHNKEVNVALVKAKQADTFSNAKLTDANFSFFTETFVATASIGTRCVRAGGMLGAGLFRHTFIDVHALIVDHDVALLAGTLEASRDVLANLITVVGVEFAFIDVCATLIVNI